jgi:hypothetical protein
VFGSSPPYPPDAANSRSTALWKADFPAPNSTARTDGAASGVLELQTGDELHFNCHITFTDARAAEVKLPKTAQEIGTLTFANEAYTAEMCSLLGSTVNVQLPSSPEWSTRKLPSFAGL